MSASKSCQRNLVWKFVLDVLSTYFTVKTFPLTKAQSRPLLYRVSQKLFCDIFLFSRHFEERKNLKLRFIENCFQNINPRWMRMTMQLSKLKKIRNGKCCKILLPFKCQKMQKEVSEVWERSRFYIFANN